MPAPDHAAPTPWVTAAVAACVLFAPASHAHLSIIRQGLDSAASLDPGDRHGSALAVGDFDGDGRDDLAVGAPNETVSLPGGTAYDAGAVVVSYACPTGVGLCKERAQLFTSTPLGIDSQGHAHFGFALASGHFNDDQYADLAIGAPDESVSTRARAGRVYILYGGEDGLSAAGSTTLIQSDAGGLPVVERDDRFGAALAAGNFNGDVDQLDDLVVGSPGEDSDAGAIFYFPASGGGITTIGSRWLKQSSLDPGYTNEAGSRFGSSLAAGNLYGPSDGGAVYEDVAVGAPWRTVSMQPGAGVVYLVKGGPTGLTGTQARQYSADDEAPGTASQYAFFGGSLAAGRFSDGDFYSLAIGEPERDLPGANSAGRVLLPKGTEDGLDFHGFAIRALTQALAGGVIEAQDWFGNALAAGDFDGNGYDDLAVGSPGENNPEATDDVGFVQVFLGSPAGVVVAGASAFSQRDLNDDEVAYDLMGYAVTFGRFDDSWKANLAVGTPGQDDDEDAFDDTPLENDVGCVFIIAPWRQPWPAVTGVLNRSTVVLDCEGRIVFSQRPYDRIYPLSTTKVMPLLLACEKAQADASLLQRSYTIPPWVANEVGGSTASLLTWESLTLDGLMKACITQSGNDAAYAIADLLWYIVPNGSGARDWIVDSLVTDMATKAALLELPNTQFTNPTGDEEKAGYYTLNYSSAAGMAILGRAALQNPLFRPLANTTSWEVVRDWAGFEVRVVYRWNWMTSLKRNVCNVPADGCSVTGIKTGGSGTGIARLVSAGGLGGSVVVGMFDIPVGTTEASLYPQYTKLLNLGFSRCSPSTVVTYEPDTDPVPFFDRDSVGTHAGERGGDAVGFDDSEGDSVLVEVSRRSGTTPAALRLELTRTSAATLRPGEEALFGVAPFESYAGIRILNTGDFTVTVGVMPSHPPTLTTYIIPPNGSAVLPAYTGPRQASFSVMIRNLATNTAEVDVEEMAYGFELLLNPSGGPGVSSFSSLLAVSGAVRPLGLLETTAGQDANPGNLVRVVAHGPGATPVDVPGDTQTVLPALRLMPAWPNPFGKTTHLRFELGRKGKVQAAIYNALGRRVWRFEGGSLPPGHRSFEWDGLDQKGRRLPNGVYLYLLQLDGQRMGSGKLILAR